MTVGLSKTLDKGRAGEEGNVFIAIGSVCKDALKLLLELRILSVPGKAALLGQCQLTL